MAGKVRDVCELFCYNREKVNALRRSMLSEGKITALTDIFGVLGDSTRTRMLLALSKGELCVCDVAHVLGLSISAVSHQLRLLRNFGLVKYRSEGRMAFYSLNDEHIMKLVGEGIKHVNR